MKRTIVCLVGSSRFTKEFEEAAKLETFAMSLVLTYHVSKHDVSHQVTKDALEELYLDRIRICDELLVVDCSLEGDSQPYVGPDTQKKIDFALSLGKKVRYTSKEWV